MSTGSDTPEGRVVLVTGGNRGIGAATAAWFLERGDRVAVTYRGDPAPVAPADAADRFLAVRADVTAPETVDAAFDQIEATIKEHERDKHGRKLCAGTRVCTVAWIAHRLGLLATDNTLSAIMFELKEIEAACPDSKGDKPHD